MTLYCAFLVVVRVDNMTPIFFRPVDPWFIAQPFGTNWVCINDSTRELVGVDHTTGLCPAGTRSVYSSMRGHNGLDIPTKRWQPVYAAREGTVVEVETEVSRGLGVGVYHDLGSYGKWKTRYWHLAAINVHLGDRVETGQLLGYADSTGYSTADHLHFEVKPQLAPNVNAEPDNGYFGSVDPLPLLLPTPAWKVNTLRTTMNIFAGALEKLADFLRYFKL